MPPALTAATPPDAPQRPNALSWSPTFSTTLLLHSEDYNLCTLDVRALFAPTQIYKAHVSMVMSCNWSPTGTEFVSGSWNRTARIWKEGVGGRPEVYHTNACRGMSHSHSGSPPCAPVGACSTPHVLHSIEHCSRPTRGSSCPSRTTGTCGRGRPMHQKNWGLSTRASGRR